MQEIRQGYSENLIISAEDNDLINVSQKFLEKLENEYQKYKDKINKIEEEFKEILDNKELLKNNYFYPEELAKKSPLTILNAPWGMGKTYFIERFAKNFITDKIKKNIFENIIVLDVWKYSDSKNIPEDIMSELFMILCDKFANQKENLKKIASFLFNTTGRPWIKKYLNVDLGKIEKKDDKFENLLNKINEKDKLPKTIIVFDNIERLGKDSWEIIKALFKISQIDNFCFILPMNISKLQNNGQDIEFPIEKYIDLPYFNIEQNYLFLLKNIGFDEVKSSKINFILKSEIEKRNLTIREVEQRIRKLNISKKDLNLNKLIEDLFGISKKEMIVHSLNTEKIYSPIKKYLIEKWSILKEFRSLLKSKEFLDLFSEKIESLKEFINKWNINLNLSNISYSKSNFENRDFNFNSNFSIHLNELKKELINLQNKIIEEKIEEKFTNKIMENRKLLNEFYEEEEKLLWKENGEKKASKILDFEVKKTNLKKQISKFAEISKSLDQAELFIKNYLIKINLNLIRLNKLIYLNNENEIYFNKNVDLEIKKNWSYLFGINEIKFSDKSISNINLFIKNFNEYIYNYSIH